MLKLTIQQAYDLALEHHRAERLKEAQRLYRQILCAQPTHAGALHYLGVIAHQAGEHDTAVDLIRKAIAIKPDYPEAYDNLGSALQKQGQLDDAIAAFRTSIELNRDRKELGQTQEALAWAADKPETLNNLGNALLEKGELGEAIAAYRKALALKQNFPEAWNSLGNALASKGQINEALEAFRKALILQPDYAEAHNNLGNMLREGGQLDEAVASFRQALAAQPERAEFFNNLGCALRDQGRIEEALTEFAQAVALKPTYFQAHSNRVYSLHLDVRQNARTIAAEHERWNRQHAEPLRHLIQSHANDPNPDRRLRIGYVSGDFRDHVLGRYVMPLFREHDHGRFEIFCYAHVRRPDALTTEFRERADHWREIAGLSDEQAAGQVRRDRIDILVDLTLHMNNARLLIFARKPAPVQLTFAGYPGTTGLETIDYRLSDPHLDPPGGDESVYSERTLRLPDSFWCYDPLECRDVEVNPLPALVRGGVTFGCLNSFSKINPSVLGLWARLLLQVPSARLMLLAHAGSHRERTRSFMKERGLDPERIEFAGFQPRRKYLELYHHIDIGVDCFPYNGHTTSLDSLWMGVPVITLSGQTAVGRGGRSILCNLGLSELVASTPEQYVRLAAELAGNLEQLRHLRGALRARMLGSRLMNAAKFARDVETAYRVMWRTWCGSAAARQR